MTSGKQLWQNTFAIIRLTGATKVISVKEMKNGAIQVTYIRNKGKCSCFLSKKAFEKDILDSRNVRSYDIAVTVLTENDAIIENKTNGKVYVIEDGHCDCPDHTYRHVVCKHMLAFQRAILDTMYVSDFATTLKQECENPW